MSYEIFSKGLRVFLLLCACLICLTDGRAEDGRLGIINDKDGYTYIHQEAAKDSKVIATVHKNEQFRVFPNDGNWWRVRTAKGVEGYMHQSRIRLLEEPDPAPATNNGK